MSSEPVKVVGNSPLSWRLDCACGCSLWCRTAEEARQDMAEHLLTDPRHAVGNQPWEFTVHRDPPFYDTDKEEQ